MKHNSIRRGNIHRYNPDPFGICTNAAPSRTTLWASMSCKSSDGTLNRRAGGLGPRAKLGDRSRPLLMRPLRRVGVGEHS